MPTRHTSALHANRWSAPGVRYFVTCCTVGRRGDLTAPDPAGVMQAAVAAADARGDTETLACTVMPDHHHWLFQLGARLALGRVVARFKTETREALAAGGLAWQRDFFEHRLRAEEIGEDYARYIFLNPHRAGLVSGAIWPGWHCPRPEIFRFMALLNEDGSPPRAWLGEALPERLVVGE